MNEPNSQNEKPKDQRRLDPKLLKRGYRCDLDQYEFLKKCLGKGEEGIKEWNEWRWKKQNRHKDIQLEGAGFEECCLKNINLGLKGVEYDGEWSGESGLLIWMTRMFHMPILKEQIVRAP